MAWFKDLSDYSYFKNFARPGTFNIGWLEPEAAFEVGALPEDLKEILWQYGKVAVVQTRGLHRCGFCGQCPVTETWKGEEKRFGSAEIRVFGSAGEIYAAPNLIFHYVHTHHYLPPPEFIRALAESAAPPLPEYFQKLKDIDLAWFDFKPAMLTKVFSDIKQRATKVSIARLIVEMGDATVIADIERILETSDDAEINGYLKEALARIELRSSGEVKTGTGKGSN